MRALETRRRFAQTPRAAFCTSARTWPQKHAKHAPRSGDWVKNGEYILLQMVKEVRVLADGSTETSVMTYRYGKCWQTLRYTAKGTPFPGDYELVGTTYADSRADAERALRDIVFGYEPDCLARLIARVTGQSCTPRSVRFIAVHSNEAQTVAVVEYTDGREVTGEYGIEKTMRWVATQ